MTEKFISILFYWVKHPINISDVFAKILRLCDRQGKTSASVFFSHSDKMHLQKHEQNL